MSDNVTLKLLRCPTCGAELKAENDTQVITCVYCGNSIVPVTKSAQPEGAVSTTVRVEGIKTSSSALAYLDLFFEEYDWEAFGYAQNLSIGEIDELATSLKFTSADDKDTWLVCFRAAAVPFTHKVASCQRILTGVIEAYQKDNPDAYSMFDAYKRISDILCRKQPSLVANLKKIAEKAEKYGASAQELTTIRENIDTLERVTLQQYSSIESIPEIQTFNREKNNEIQKALAAKGINAQAEYDRVKALVSQKKYQEALAILLSLNGYEDTEELIDRLDKQFRIADVLEISGRLYCLKTDSEHEDEKQFALYEATEKGLLAEEPILRNIKRVVTNYADMLYYMTAGGKLKKFDLSTKTAETVFAGPLHTSAYYLYDWKGYFYAKHQDEDKPLCYELVQVDLMTGANQSLLKDVADVLSVQDNMLIYSVREAAGTDNEGEPLYRSHTRIFNVETREILDLGAKQVTIHGFLDGCAVYTQETPNSYNQNLYVKSFRSDEPERLIERNIYRFHDIEAGLLFYYIGNSGNQTLISIHLDGTDRRQWPTFVTQVNAELGGWLYFTRESGYNSVFCRSRLDGSRFKVIAPNPDEFLTLKNGYLYYLTGSTLMRVRMDGSNQQTLCADVEKVLSIHEDKIIFVSIDDRIRTQDEDEVTVTKTVKSIYAVELSGGGKRKLAYDIKTAEQYDENTVYYIAAKEKSSSDDADAGSVEVLYRLSVETIQSQQLLQLQVEPAAEKGMSGFAIAMMVAALSLLFGFIFLTADAGPFAVFLIIIGFISLIAGLFLKKPANDD